MQLLLLLLLLALAGVVVSQTVAFVFGVWFWHDTATDQRNDKVTITHQNTTSNNNKNQKPATLQKTKQKQQHSNTPIVVDPCSLQIQRCCYIVVVVVFSWVCVLVIVGLLSLLTVPPLGRTCNLKNTEQEQRCQSLPHEDGNASYGIAIMVIPQHTPIP